MTPTHFHFVLAPNIIAKLFCNVCCFNVRERWANRHFWNHFSHYSIVAPDVIRPNSDYHVAISLHESSTPCEIRVGIEGIRNRYANFRDVTLQPYTSQFIRFNTGYMDPGQYQLVGEGLSGIDFRNEKPLSVVSKNVSIFVQTDKAIYKPNDLVQFRILVLDLNLKPHQSLDPINIFITVRRWHPPLHTCLIKLILIQGWSTKSH